MSPFLISLFEAGEFFITLPTMGAKFTVPKKKNTQNNVSHAEIILKPLPANKIKIFFIKLKF